MGHDSYISVLKKTVSMNPSFTSSGYILSPLNRPLPPYPNLAQGWKAWEEISLGNYNNQQISKAGEATSFCIGNNHQYSTYSDSYSTMGFEHEDENKSININHNNADF